MAIMTRILRLWKADIHGVMDQLEDKELLLKQYLREMKSSLNDEEERLQRTSSIIERLKNLISECKEEIAKLEKDLELALRKDNDEIAKILIRKQRGQQRYSEEMQRKLEGLELEQAESIAILNEHRLQYETMRAKTEAYCQNKKITKDKDSFSKRHIFSGFGSLDNTEIELELMRRKEAMSREN